MTVVVSHPTGNANVRGVLRALEANGMLDSFHTTIAIPSPIARSSIVPMSLRDELHRRVFSEVPAAKMRPHPGREVVRQLARRIGMRSLVAHETGVASVDRVYEDLDRAVARWLARTGTHARAIYAYEDGALHSFRAARARGMRTIYELPIAYWRTVRQLLEEERYIRPEWSPTMDALKDSAAKYERKDEEIRLADHVVVASSFTRKSLTGHFGDEFPIEVAAYGAPPPNIQTPSVRAPGEPLRVFYAGHLNQRKGLAYLFDSLQRADFNWVLTLAGAKPAEPCPALETALKDPRCHWLGTIPHAVLLKEMTKAHVFVFPSLIEGFGLVILEALAAGLPVITTIHTAGPDCIDEGIDGHVVPIRDADAITSRLAVLYDDEDRRMAMASAALEKARRLSWSCYEQRISAIIAKALM